MITVPLFVSFTEISRVLCLIWQMFTYKVEVYQHMID